MLAWKVAPRVGHPRSVRLPCPDACLPHTALHSYPLLILCDLAIRISWLNGAVRRNGSGLGKGSTIVVFRKKWSILKIQRIICPRTVDPFIPKASCGEEGAGPVRCSPQPTPTPSLRCCKEPTCLVGSRAQLSLQLVTGEDVRPNATNCSS